MKGYDLDSQDVATLQGKFFVFLAGYARSGKDTVADMLVNKLDNAERFAFADTLKDEVCNCIGVNRNQLDLFKNENKEGRRLLQSYGETMKYFYGKYYWINKLLNKVVSSVADVIVISDFRFPYEAGFVADLGLSAAFVKIVNDRVQINNHISENSLVNVAFPYIIENNGSLEDLLLSVDKLIADLS